MGMMGNQMASSNQFGGGGLGNMGMGNQQMGFKKSSRADASVVAKNR